MIQTRSLSELRGSPDERWFQPALSLLASVAGETNPRLSAFAEEREPLYIARAPGRLDVMGGIADYSGSLVLQLPLARSTSVIVQRRATPTCEILSLRRGVWHWFEIGLEELLHGRLRERHALAAAFQDRRDPWAAYIVGGVQLLLRLRGDALAELPGLRLLITSDIPEGRGIAASAALEVASLAAVAAAYGLDVTAEDLAAAGQRVENHVVGAPCGIMDQTTSACGRTDRLLRLRCQPAIIEGWVRVPPGYRFYGIDSGLRHAVTGEDYVAVRTAAFMGYRIIAAAQGLPVTHAGGLARVADPEWDGYLANVPPADLAARYQDLLPERLSGADFLQRFRATTDGVTRVQPDRQYPVRAATTHPVYENERVERFSALLGDLASRPACAEQLGELMYASHAAYGACGLGSESSDRLVELVRKKGPQSGLFGAKITGGGRGSTVAILATEAAEQTVHRIARAYAAETGRATEVFSESGPGTEQTGVLVTTASEIRARP